MDSTTNLSLPFIMPAQAQKHVTHNEALAMLDAMVQLAVTSRTLSMPPAAPVEGARYIVAANATGDWTGRDGTIAFRFNGVWLFFTPSPGWTAYSLADAQLFFWNGTAWAAVSPVLGSQTLSALLTTNGQIAFPAAQNASTGATTLDDYREGVFTPGLAFGGSATGIVLATQTGTYTKVGNLVAIHTCLVGLSSKGTAAGQATITGLPFPVSSSGAASVGFYTGFAGLGGPPLLLVDASAAGLRLYNPGAVSSASLTDANFTNTTQFRASFVYRTA